MQIVTRTTDADFWLSQMFAARAARTVGVLRRSRAWIEREVGHDRFELEVRRRGFHMIETADQFIKRFAKNLNHSFSRNALVICHNKPIRIIF